MKSFFDDIKAAIESVTGRWLEDGTELSDDDMVSVCSMFLMQAATAGACMPRKAFIAAARQAHAIAVKEVAARRRAEDRESRAEGRGLLDSILGGPLDPEIKEGDE